MYGENILPVCGCNSFMSRILITQVKIVINVSTLQNNK